MGNDDEKRQQELARSMLQKAQQDFDAAKNFSESKKVADEIIGFHAQQTIEKALKAILTRASIEFEHTHDLVSLFEEVEKLGHKPPASSEDVEELTPFAVQFRYTVFSDVEPLDRKETIELAEKFIKWAQEIVEK